MGPDDEGMIHEHYAFVDRLYEATLRLCEAAQARIKAGHNDTCEVRVVGHEYACTCGHDALVAAHDSAHRASADAPAAAPPISPDVEALEKILSIARGNRSDDFESDAEANDEIVAIANRALGR